MKAILVGEAWGEREERFQHALVGPSGRELARMLNESGLAPALPHQYPSELEMIRYWRRVLDECEIDITNVFNEHPPANNNGIFFDREGNKDFPPIKIKSSVKYLLPTYAHHVLRLWDEIRTKEPNLIVPMGNIACWALLGKTYITKIRGTVQYTIPNLGQLKTLPTYHPAYILYEGGWANRPIVLADLSKAKREMEFPEIRRQERWITVADSLSEIRGWFNRPASSYAIDIESGYALFSGAEIKNMTSQMRQLLSSQISMVSFARSKSDALVIQFMNRESPGMNFWPEERDEIQAWSLTKRGLTRPIPKIFQNGVYDIGRFLEIGIAPTMCREDTMLRHHSMYSEMLKGLGFLGSIYTDELAWKQSYGNRETLKRDE